MLRYVRQINVVLHNLSYTTIDYSKTNHLVLVVGTDFVIEILIKVLLLNFTCLSFVTTASACPLDSPQGLEFANKKPIAHSRIT